ncbi:MAG: N-formylglutamate amidohydrolase [Woeseia sp.]|nr:N-formylglutamate amidohydrolase [Woeseia sp.]MBT8096699.1 N-formylglutamate amidohydrolase [Woeseia sp.]NNE59375.1 N-formylglutamate amidohydrolase [Woeseia sp.]
MTDNKSNKTLPADTLLAADEPAPFRVLNPDSTSSLLLVCDHASRRIPAALGVMGLDPPALRCHLAWDIGAGALTEHLAKRLNVTAVLCNYSRLVVDCNRQLLDPQAFLEYSDGVIVYGNRGLSEEQKETRAREIFWPYHEAVAGQISRLQKLDATPAILAIHSFTPVFNGVFRPWEIGILWDKDADVPDILIPALREAGFNVGDNEPYSGRAPQDYTLDHHAEAAGLQHAGVEVRQDLIAHSDGVLKMADAFEKVLKTMPEALGRKGSAALLA